jgi:hypothetical protein
VYTSRSSTSGGGFSSSGRITSAQLYADVDIAEEPDESVAGHEIGRDPVQIPGLEPSG